MKKRLKILTLFFFLNVSCQDIQRPSFISLLLAQSLPGNIGVATTDFGGGGRFKVVNPSLLYSYPGLTPIHSDAVVRFGIGRVFVLNGLNRDSIQVLEPNYGFITSGELSLGPKVNPVDMEFAGPSKAYVTLYGSHRLLIVDPTYLSVIGSIDLGAYAEPFSLGGSPDGNPEMKGMKIVGDSLFVCLQRLDRNDPSGYFPPNTNSLLLEINILTDTVTGVYPFPSANPVGKPQLVDLFGEPHLIFATPARMGFLSQIDGGVSAFRLSARTFVSRLLYSEVIAGGDILGVQIKSDTIGYVSVLDSGFNKTLQVFNPSNGAKLGTLLSITSSYDASLSSILLASDRILYAGNTQFQQPGVSMFDTERGDALLTPTPISVDLQPYDIIELK
ncbi:YncE family protein [Leptospira sp. WS92.C1]